MLIQISENKTKLTSNFLLKFTMHLSECSLRIYRAKSQATTKNTLQMQILFFRNDKAKVPENRNVIDSVLSVTLLRKVPENRDVIDSVLSVTLLRKVPENRDVIDSVLSVTLLRKVPENRKRHK